MPSPSTRHIEVLLGVTSIDATVSPSAVAAVAAITTPTVTASATVTALVVSAVAAVTAPTVSAGSGVTITAVEVATIAAVGAPTISLSMSTSPSVVSAITAVAAPEVQADQSIFVISVAAAADVGAPPDIGTTSDALIDLSFTDLTAEAAVGTPVIAGDLFVTPASVAAYARITGPNVQTEIVSTPDDSNVVQSKVMRSKDDVIAVQFATVETPALQRLHDDEFRDPDLVTTSWDNDTRWHRIGDGTTITYLQSVTKIRVERAVQAAPIFSAAPTGLVQPIVHHVFASRTQSQLDADDVARSIGGFESEQVDTSTTGRIWAAVRFTALRSLTSPLKLQIVGSDGTVLAQKDIDAVRGQTIEEFIGYTIGDANEHEFVSPVFQPRSLVERPMHRTAHPDELDTFVEPPTPPVKDDQVRVRLVQQGFSDDAWEIDALSLFEDAVVWEFSNDGGSTFVPAFGIRNNPNGICQFPRLGNQLVWKATAYHSRVHVNSIQVRPWYRATYRTRALAQRWGPTLSGFDQFPQIEDDPMFQQWSKPIPRKWWLAGKSLPALPIVGHPVSNEFNTFVGRTADEDISGSFDEQATRRLFLIRGASESIPVASDTAERQLFAFRSVEETTSVDDRVFNFTLIDGDGAIVQHPFAPLDNVHDPIRTVLLARVPAVASVGTPTIQTSQGAELVFPVTALAAAGTPTITASASISPSAVGAAAASGTPAVEVLIPITSEDFNGSLQSLDTQTSNAGLGGSGLTFSVYTGATNPVWRRDGSGKGTGTATISGGVHYPCYLQVNSSATDHQAELTLSTLPGSGDFLGVAVRQPAGGYTGYYLWAEGDDSNKAKLIRADSFSTWVVLATYASVSAGAKLRLQAKGSVLKVYIDGALIDTVTDSTYTTQTRCSALVRKGAICKADDFAVYQAV